MNIRAIVGIVVLIIMFLAFLSTLWNPKVRPVFKVLSLIPTCLIASILFAVIPAAIKQAKETGKQTERTGWVTNEAAFPEEARYSIGETWTVPGQWALTINSVRETDDRTPAIKHDPAAVYVINYTIENLGYEKNGSSDLYFSLDTYIKDSAGENGYAYLADEDPDLAPRPTYKGEQNDIEIAIGVDHAGDFELGVFDADMNGEMQKALFEIKVE